MFCEYYLNKGAEGAEVFTGEITFGICFQSTSVKIKNHGAKILLIQLLHFMLLNIMFIFSLFVVAPSKKSP